MSFADQFPDIVTDEPNVYKDKDSQRLVAQQLEQGRNIGTLVMAQAAERDGANVSWLGTYSAVAEKDGRRVLFRGHMSTDTATSGLIVIDKYLAKRLLQDAGVPTPRGQLVSSAEEAVEVARELDTAVVVKPRFGSQGKGVTVNVVDNEEIVQAFHGASLGGRGVLVEEYIEGIEFRLLATPEKCFGAVRRLLPHVTGDGESTIQELIDAKNETRKKNPNNCRLLIPVDRSTNRHLDRQGFTLQSVLPQDARITVRNVGGISSGGDASECRDLLAQEVLDVGRNAINAIPTMDWGGADILIEKSTGNPYLLELNTNAAISNSTYPVYGAPKDVGGPAWKRLFERASIDGQMDLDISRRDSVENITDDVSDHGASPQQIRTNALARHLQTRGWEVEIKSPRLIVSKQAGKPDKWFNGLMDERFYASVSSLLRRHHLVQQVMKQRDLPVPRSLTVRTLEDIHAYYSRADTELVLIPRDAGWQARTPFEASSIEYPGEPGQNFTAQRVMTGTRLRVCASRKRPLAILSTDREVTLSENLTQRISSTAINAVRSIPALPWAFVDILVRDSAKQSILTEGMSVRPNLSDFPVLLAGSTTAVFDEITGLSPERLTTQ